MDDIKPSTQITLTKHIMCLIDFCCVYNRVYLGNPASHGNIFSAVRVGCCVFFPSCVLCVLLRLSSAAVYDDLFVRFFIYASLLLVVVFFVAAISCYDGFLHKFRCRFIYCSAVSISVAMNVFCSSLIVCIFAVNVFQLLL